MNAAIVAAKRTPIGSFMGALSTLSAVDLGTIAARAALANVSGIIADVVVGNVLQAGSGMNIARQIALGAGLPSSVPGQTINRVCGSGLQAVIAAIQALQVGDGKAYLSGGVESMSNAPHLLLGARSGYRFGNGDLVDSITKDGLSDPSHNYLMGVTAENIASALNITREEQDSFAVESQRRAAKAIKCGAFDAEIVPVTVASRVISTTISADEHPRPGTTMEALAKLKPAFLAEGGTVTAGNSSGLNDGAAMLTITTDDHARDVGLPVLAHVLSYATVGVDPSMMGMGPAAAIPIALRRAGLSINDIDLFELNEAFAAQSIAVIRKLNIDQAKVNPFGGAIALGHPIGASGARVLVTLVHALHSLKKEHGVASLCIGGGMGIAIVIRATISSGITIRSVDNS